MKCSLTGFLFEVNAFYSFHNSKMNRLFLTLSLLILAADMTAQTFQGKVTDANDKPLDAVSVTLLGQGGRIVAFSKTDKNGEFSVSTPENKTAETITFSRMGYAKVITSLTNFHNRQTVIMQEETLVLKEVKVTSERIKQNGDTLVFSVAGFKQQQDRTIADVIRKMPGLVVQNDGKITYQGKAINEFTVEGMDLTGGKYTQISENLSADKVKSVEVRENNQPKRVLRNVQFSEQAALNLILKDDAKNVWQGLVDCSTGCMLQDDTDWLYDTRLMAMAFGKKHQSVSMWKTNNTGKNIQREMGDLIFDSNFLAPLNSRLSSINESSADIERERYTFNNSQLAATNWLFKTKEDVDLRFQASYFFDKTKSHDLSETIYNDVAGGWSLVEDADVRNYTSKWEGELQFKINNDQMFFNNRLKANVNFNRSLGTTSLNNTMTREFVKPRSRFVSDAMEMIGKTKGGNSYTLSSVVAYDFLPGRMLLCDSTTQRLDISSLRWNTMTNFRHKLWIFNVSWNAGFNLTLNKMNVDNPLMVRDNVRYNEQRLYAYPGLTYDDKKLQVNFSPKMSWVRREYETSKRNDFLFEPMVFVGYKQNSKIDYGLHYNVTYVPDGMDQICDIPIFTSYRTMIQGDMRLDKSYTHSLSSFFRYHHIANGLFANANISYYSSKHTKLYSSMVDGNFYRQYATGLYDNVEGWSASVDGSKTIPWAKTILKIGCSWNNNIYHLLVGNVKMLCRMDNWTANVGFSMKPTRMFSIEEKSYLSHSVQKNKSLNTKSILNHYQHEIKMFLLPGKWQIEVDNEFYHSNDHSVSFCHFADMAVSYRTKRYEVGIWVNNIMRTDKYERTYDTFSHHVYAATRLRPREMMVKVFFNL